jgi:1,4-dihydroxy-2-naphthoate octaprenyltransferase
VSGAGRKARAFALAARPGTLAASVAPVVVGAAAAAGAGAFRAGPALGALAGALFLQIGTNMANDVLDHARGADGPDRLGPRRAVAAGLLSPREAALGAAAAFAAAAAVGAYLAALGGWPIAALGTLGALAGVAYTGGPWPLGYHGLGDPIVFAFFGLFATGGTYFVMAGTVGARVIAGGAALGCLATAILAVNNLRDRASDARCGKRTLAVVLGARATRAYYAALLAAAYAIAVGLARSPGGLLPLATLPLAAALARAVARGEGAALNAALAGTARLLALFALLWAPSWARP